MDPVAGDPVASLGAIYQKTREGYGCSKFVDGKVFPGNFAAAWKFFPDFPAARHAIPAKVWALSGKENGCWKIGRAFGNAAGIFSSETATAFLSSSEFTPRRNHYRNNSLRVIRCNGRASLHWIYVMTPKMASPDFFYVMANPISHAQNSSLPSAISWRTVDYMKIMQWTENSFPRILFNVRDVFSAKEKSMSWAENSFPWIFFLCAWCFFLQRKIKLCNEPKIHSPVSFYVCDVFSEKDPLS